MVWKDQDFFQKAFDQFGMSVPGIPEIRCYFLQSSIRSLNAIDGSVAECGSREGKSALYMLTACERKREFYLFDSFEGLSDPTSGKDIITTSIDKSGEKRLFYANYDDVEKRFIPFDNVHLMRGWIPERFKEVEDKTFSLVHIDVDLYEPTKDSFEFFYERLASGGMMICDDYGSGAYPGARLAMDEFFEKKREKPIELPQGQAFIVKL